MSMQRWPHDGVAALAVSAPAVASPPASASVAAAATNLLLMDITWFLLGTCGGAPCTAAEPGLTRKGAAVPDRSLNRRATRQLGCHVSCLGVHQKSRMTPVTLFSDVTEAPAPEGAGAS